MKIKKTNFFFCLLSLQLIRYNSNLVAAIKMLIFLHSTNKDRKDIVHYELFQWPELQEFVDIQQEYVHWLFNKTVSYNLNPKI